MGNCMKKCDITFAGDTYAINRQLNLKPWEPEACSVWKGDDPEWLSPDGRMLIADAHGPWIIDVETGRELWRGPKSPAAIQAAAWSPT